MRWTAHVPHATAATQPPRATSRAGTARPDGDPRAASVASILVKDRAIPAVLAFQAWRAPGKHRPCPRTPASSAASPRRLAPHRRRALAAIAAFPARRTAPGSAGRSAASYPQPLHYCSRFGGGRCTILSPSSSRRRRRTTCAPRSPRPCRGPVRRGHQASRLAHHPRGYVKAGLTLTAAADGRAAGLIGVYWCRWCISGPDGGELRDRFR